jgi:hypothetical protein
MKIGWLSKLLSTGDPLARTDLNASGKGKEPNVAPPLEPSVVHLRSSIVSPQSFTVEGNLEDISSTRNIRQLELHGAELFHHARGMTVKDLTAYKLKQLQLRVNKPNPGSQGKYPL